MKIKAVLALLFSVMLVFGLTSFTNAQTIPGKEEKQTKEQKDDDGEDEEITPKDRERVKITVEQARRTALEKVGGTIVEEELEKENGKLLYSIEIRDANGKIFDVEVDAETGAIFKVEAEDDDDDNDDNEKGTKPPQ